MRLTLEQGKFLVSVARSVIERHVKGERIGEINFPSWCSIKRGVFVTLETHPERELRGCIGFPLPVKSLKDALVECAVEACHDPRFRDVSEDELDKITVEISVLTPPEKINYRSADELLEKITPRRDGIILRRGWASGLFLPQVWEKLPEKRAFLSNLCLKAGLPHDAWERGNIEVFKFAVQAFRERSPRGSVEEVKL